jgi:DNA-binding transcriptional ArsR family regulator
MQQADSLLDHTLIALADPTRRAILKRLARGEARVTDLAEPFAISLNSVSKHIKLLERAELVSRRKAGREYIMSFRPGPLREARQWIELQERFWKAGLEAMDAVLAADEEKEQNR